jgi:hypothetical protein
MKGLAATASSGQYLRKARSTKRVWFILNVTEVE